MWEPRSHAFPTHATRWYNSNTKYCPDALTRKKLLWFSKSATRRNWNEISYSSSNDFYNFLMIQTLVLISHKNLTNFPQKLFWKYPIIRYPPNVNFTQKIAHLATLAPLQSNQSTWWKTETAKIETPCCVITTEFH